MGYLLVTDSNIHCSAGDRTDLKLSTLPCRYKLESACRKTVQVYHIPNLYSVTYAASRQSGFGVGVRVGRRRSCCCCVPILLTTSPPEPQRNVSIAAVRGTVRPSKGGGRGGGGGGGGEERKVYIVGPGHMTKMAAPLIYGKNLNDQADCLESWNVTYGTLVLQILYNLDRIYGKVKLGPLGF